MEALIRESWHFLAVAFATILSSILLYPRVIRRLVKANITGRDQNKPDKPVVAEMGGLVIVASVTVGLLMAVSFQSFGLRADRIDTQMAMASLASVLIVAIIGVFDDLLDMRKPIKIFSPALAALPLVAVKAGVTKMQLPLIGWVDFGLWYPLLIVPIGMTGATNAANILAGYNGLEAGMGLIATVALAIVTYTTGEHTAFLLLLCTTGPLLVTLYYNWYPARVFIGDVGTLTIGAVLAAGCVLGNCETAGVIVMIPHAIDFLFFKARYRLPAATWGEPGRDGKLYCPSGGPKGLGQFVLRVAGGLREPHVVLVLMAFELACAAAAVALYARF